MNKIDEILYLIYQEDVLPKSITVKVSDLQEISRQTNALKVAAKKLINAERRTDYTSYGSRHMAINQEVDNLAALLDDEAGQEEG